MKENLRSALNITMMVVSITIVAYVTVKGIKKAEELIDSI